MARTNWRGGEPIEPEIQEQLRELIRIRGGAQVAKALRISQVALGRAALGDGVRRGTAYIIKGELPKLLEEARAA